MSTRPPAFAHDVKPDPNKFCKIEAPTFRRASPDEINALASALKMNSSGHAVTMDPHTTEFDGIMELDEREVEDAMIDAVRSVPTHY